MNISSLLNFRVSVHDTKMRLIHLVVISCFLTDEVACSDRSIQFSVVLVKGSVYLHVLLTIFKLSLNFSFLWSVLVITLSNFYFIFVLFKSRFGFNFELRFQRDWRSFGIGALDVFFRVLSTYTCLYYSLINLIILFNWLIYLILFVAESEVVRILLLFISSVTVSACILVEVVLEHLVWFINRIIITGILVSGSKFSYIDTYMAVVVCAEANVVLYLIIDVVLRTRMSRPVFIAITISVHMGCCRSQTTVAYCITTSTLVAKRNYFGIDFFPLAQMWTVFQAICLLNEKHVSMILRSLNNLGSCSSIFSVDIITLIWLRAHRTICMWMCCIYLGYLLPFRTISCSETTKPWGIHLLLYKETQVGIGSIVLRPFIDVMIWNIGVTYILLFFFFDNVWKVRVSISIEHVTYLNMLLFGCLLTHLGFIVCGWLPLFCIISRVTQFASSRLLLLGGV